MDGHLKDSLASLNIALELHYKSNNIKFQFTEVMLQLSLKLLDWITANEKEILHVEKLDKKVNFKLEKTLV